MMLLPNECNLHVFEAQTPCALLDLLTPPYRPGDGECCVFVAFFVPLFLAFVVCQDGVKHTCYDAAPQ